MPQPQFITDSPGFREMRHIIHPGRDMVEETPRITIDDLRAWRFIPGPGEERQGTITLSRNGERTGSLQATVRMDGTELHPVRLSPGRGENAGDAPARPRALPVPPRGPQALFPVRVLRASGDCPLPQRRLLRLPALPPAGLPGEPSSRDALRKAGPGREPAVPGEAAEGMPPSQEGEQASPEGGRVARRVLALRGRMAQEEGEAVRGR